MDFLQSLQNRYSFSQKQSVNLRFRGAGEAKELEIARQAFKAFTETWASHITSIQTDIQQYESEIRQTIETSPEFIAEKQKKLATIRESLIRTATSQGSVVSAPTIPDPRFPLRTQKMKALIKLIQTKAFEQNDPAAKIILYAVQDSLDGMSLDFMLSPLKAIDQTWSDLKGREKSFLIVKDVIILGKKIVLQSYLPQETLDKTKTALMDSLQTAAAKGDEGAQLILWTREPSCGLNHYDLSRLPEMFPEGFILQISTLGRTPTYQDRPIDNVSENLNAVLDDAKPWIEKIAQAYQAVESREGVHDKLTPELKAQVLKTAQNLIQEMATFETSETMQTAADQYQTAIQTAQAEALAQAEAKLGNIDQKVETEFKLYYKSSLTNTLVQQKVESFRQQKMPRQLEKWIDDSRFESDNNLPDTFNPKKLVLHNPQLPTPILTRKGFGGQVSINDYGDIELEFPSRHAGYFKAIEFLKKEGAEEHFRLTEKKENGSEESYTLITGSQTAQQEPCAAIVCDSGARTEIEYGAPFDFMYAVRKPVLAFRNFLQDTSITLKVNFSGEYEIIYPKETDRQNQSLCWVGTATADNQFVVREKHYPYLFWDGLLSSEIQFNFNQGYCISSQDTISFLEEKATEFGLDSTLVTDFVTFWAPYLQHHPYNHIRFLSQEDCNRIARVHIESSSEQTIQLLRFYMIFKPVHQYEALIAPDFTTLRTPLSTDTPQVIEWGGFQVN